MYFAGKHGQPVSAAAGFLREFWAKKPSVGWLMANLARAHSLTMNVRLVLKSN